MRIARDALRIGPPLASGSQGTIFRVEGGAPPFPFPLIYKEFNAATSVAGAALESLAGLRDGLEPAEQAVLDQRTVWPVAAVARGATVCGYVMQAIPAPFWQTIATSTGPETIAREVQHLFVADELSRRNLGEVPTALERLALCRELAFVLGFLHKRELVYGDLSYKNAVYALRPAPMVVLLDCDAVRLRGQRSAVPQLDSPGWGAPERGPQTVATDRYKLGLFVLRCCSPGINAQLRDPERVAGALDADGMALLRRALGDDPADRPSGREWVEHLDARLEAAGGVPARRSPAAPPAPPPRQARRAYASAGGHAGATRAGTAPGARPGGRPGGRSPVGRAPAGTSPGARRPSVSPAGRATPGAGAPPLVTGAAQGPGFLPVGPPLPTGTAWVRPRRVHPAQVHGHRPVVRTSWQFAQRTSTGTRFSIPQVVVILAAALIIGIAVIGLVVSSSRSSGGRAPTTIRPATTVRPTTTSTSSTTVALSVPTVTAPVATPSTPSS